MKKTLTFILYITITLLLTFSISKADIKVVTSIKPIHSLASQVMDGVGKPGLIVDGYNSPHAFNLKPSHAKMIEKADLIIWVGENMEAFLEKPLKTIGKDAINIEIMDLGIKKLKFREKNVFESHKDHGHDHKEHKEHGHKEKKHNDHGHEGHAHGKYDGHVWLDPMNAKIVIKEIETQLVRLDPDNSAKYKANSKKAQSELDNLTRNIKKDLKKDLRFVVFHDAYQYFENRFGIKVLGALTVNPDILPGAEQLSEIREIIEHEKVNCLFSEPQFNPAIIKSIAKDTKVKTGVLDPLGATIEEGKGMYAELLSNLYTSFKGC
jgi:zinc transport system substrate-binding protein